jgi:hypothetical protein
MVAYLAKVRAAGAWDVWPGFWEICALAWPLLQFAYGRLSLTLLLLLSMAVSLPAATNADEALFISSAFGLSGLAIRLLMLGLEGAVWFTLKPFEGGREALDAILVFLPAFEDENFSFGEWRPLKGHEPYFALSTDAAHFVSALHEHCWVKSWECNWPAWQDPAEEYVRFPRLLDSADVETIRNLLTTHVLADGYYAGHLARMFETGHLTALLRRLRLICEAADS